MTRYILTAAIAASALLALAVLSPQRPAQQMAVGQAATPRIEASHTLVQNQIEATLEARRSAARAADAELSASRQAASEAADRAAASAKRAKPVQVATAQLAVEPLPPPAPPQLRPPISQPDAVATPPKPPLVARVVGTVERIPGWLGSKVVNAATWVVELPGHVVSRLPERRFL